MVGTLCSDHLYQFSIPIESCMSYPCPHPLSQTSHSLIKQGNRSPQTKSLSFKPKLWSVFTLISMLMPPSPSVQTRQPEAEPETDRAGAGVGVGEGRKIVSSWNSLYLGFPFTRDDACALSALVTSARKMASVPSSPPPRNS